MFSKTQNSNNDYVLNVLTLKILVQCLIWRGYMYVMLTKIIFISWSPRFDEYHGMSHIQLYLG